MPAERQTPWTPGPWEAWAGHIYKPGSGKGEGANIAAVSALRATTEVAYTAPRIGDPDGQEIFANARHIVKCVNLHDQLVEALTDLIPDDLPDHIEDFAPEWQRAYAIVTAARKEASDE